jgi:hypothetical protein
LEGAEDFAGLTAGPEDPLRHEYSEETEDMENQYDVLDDRECARKQSVEDDGEACYRDDE